MKIEGYQKRIVDKKLEAMLRVFGGVLIVGPKWCGKSWTASNQANSEVYIDVEDNKKRALLMPEIILDGPEPRLIDEWQDAPVLWDVARRKIDKEHRPGMFILTGSAVPDISPDKSLPTQGRDVLPSCECVHFLSMKKKSQMGTYHYPFCLKVNR